MLIDPLIGVVLRKENTYSLKNISSQMDNPAVPKNHVYTDYLELKKYVKQYEEEKRRKERDHIGKRFPHFTLKAPASTKKIRRNKRSLLCRHNINLFNAYEEYDDRIDFEYFPSLKKKALCFNRKIFTKMTCTDPQTVPTYSATDDESLKDMSVDEISLRMFDIVTESIYVIAKKSWMSYII